ncbi:MAG: hypothetical protein LBI72_14985 [Flavobacteriaceae bacterium]|jgi:hypothetical protein|nr:hypothetical protein [Flavobacteriaceae bacterium]
MVKLFKGLMAVCILFSLFSFNSIKFVNASEKYKQEIIVFEPDFKGGEVGVLYYLIPQYFQIKNYESFGAINMAILPSNELGEEYELVAQQNENEFFPLSLKDNVIPLIIKNIIPNTEKELMRVYIKGKVEVSKQQWKSLNLKANAWRDSKLYPSFQQEGKVIYKLLKTQVIDQLTKEVFEKSILLNDITKLKIEAKCVLRDDDGKITFRFPIKKYEGIKLDLAGVNYRTYGITYEVFDKTLNQKKEDEVRDLDFYRTNDSKLRMDHYITISPKATEIPKQWELLFEKRKPSIYRMEVENNYLQTLVTYNEVLNPIRLIVNQENVIQGNIVNYKEIKDKWNKATQEIDFSNNTASKSLVKINNSLQDAESYLHFLKEDWFYTFYFQPFYQLPITQEVISYPLSIAFSPSATITIDGQLKRSLNVTYYDTRLIEFKGEKKIDQKTYESMFGEKIASKEIIMVIEAEWDIDDVHNMMKHMTSTFKFKVKEGKGTRVVKYISWTCYTTEESPERQIF